MEIRLAPNSITACKQPGTPVSRPGVTSSQSKDSYLDSLRPEFREFPREQVSKLAIGEVAGVETEAATISRFLGASNDFLAPEALTTANLEFGSLSPENFEILHQEFGGMSEVEFQPEKSFQVVDFLPPALQALVNQDLELPSPVTLPNSAYLDLLPREEDKTVDLTMNCHATSWLAASAFQETKSGLQVFLGDAVKMDDLLISDHFESLGKPSKLAPTGLRPGDVIAFDEDSEISRTTNLLHTAVYLGGGLFFEKPNTEMDGEDSPFRIATWSMLSKPVESYTDNQYLAKSFRPIRPLPDAAEVFSSGSLDEWSNRQTKALGLLVFDSLDLGMMGGVLGIYPTAIAEIPMKKGSDGRYGLTALHLIGKAQSAHSIKRSKTCPKKLTPPASLSDSKQPA